MQNGNLSINVWVFSLKINKTYLPTSLPYLVVGWLGDSLEGDMAGRFKGLFRGVRGDVFYMKGHPYMCILLFLYVLFSFFLLSFSCLGNFHSVC